MKKKIILIFLMLLTIVPFAANNSLIVSEANVVISDDSRNHFTIVSEIVINNDVDLAAYPGSGTKNDPYVIEGFEVISVVDPWDQFALCAVSITGTTEHFVIRNNIVRNGHTGIKIDSVAPGTANISNNEVEEAFEGIWIIDSNNTVIEKNFVHDIAHYSGVILERSSHCNITNNEINEIYRRHGSFYETSFDCIQLDNCIDVRIIDNDFIDPGYTAIRTFESKDILIEDNYIDYVDQSAQRFDVHPVIHLYRSPSVNITMNVLDATNMQEFVYCERSNDVVIHKNNMSSGIFNGIWIENSKRTNITYNKIEYFELHGIRIEADVSNNTIHHNIIKNNNPEGDSQAYDDGFNNIWYEVNTLEGNWWKGDWYGGDYIIDGTSGSVDPYPLGEPLSEISEFQLNHRLIFVLTASLVTSIILLIKKKRK
ncbi:MAG: right-handed parallel beta-helix repeat-containing protein [Candidatus Heimdallarchaeaceae archaeon]|jgi:parallel beta-helix repeat protein